MGDNGGEGTHSPYNQQQQRLLMPPPAVSQQELITGYLTPLPPGFVYQLRTDPQHPHAIQVHTVQVQHHHNNQVIHPPHQQQHQQPPSAPLAVPPSSALQHSGSSSSRRRVSPVPIAPAPATASMMIKDEHQPDVGSSRVPQSYIKEEADVSAAATSDSAAPEQLAQQPQQSPQSNNNDTSNQQQLGPLAISAATAANAANAAADASLESSFVLGDVMPTILVQQMTPVTSRTAVARLSYQTEVLYLLEAGHVVIGRNSSTSIVHFHVGRSSFISRKHFQVVHDPINQEFYVVIVSKNGIFVDDTFQRRNVVPERLPPVCSFRFPSTDIRIEFESFLRSPTRQIVMPCPLENGPGTLQSADNPFYQWPVAGEPDSGQQLQVQVQQMIPPPTPAAGPQPLQPRGKALKRAASPPPSPTGTLSAANSCPTSPRPNVREYHVAYAGPPPQQHVQAIGGPSTSAAAQQQLYTANNGYVAQPQQPQPQPPPPQQQQQQPKTIIFTPPAAPASASPVVLAPPPPPPGHPNEFDKPLFSYAQLIVQSISASPEKQLTLSGIYSFITKHYPYYRREANKGWQNSIRHNLSLNRYFLKVERSQDEPGKGSFWRIDPNSEAKLIDQSYRKRRQRGNQNFRTPYGLPRSAPASPNHMDTSQEASPMQDIVLQSAPGSPDRFQQVPAQQQQQELQQQQQQLQQQHQQQQQQQQQQNGSGGGGGNHMQIWPE